MITRSVHQLQKLLESIQEQTINRNRGTGLLLHDVGPWTAAVGNGAIR